MFSVYEGAHCLTPSSCSQAFSVRHLSPTRRLKRCRGLGDGGGAGGFGRIVVAVDKAKEERGGCEEEETGKGVRDFGGKWVNRLVLSCASPLFINKPGGVDGAL